ncbi:hypothetical protein ACFOD9_05165 [Novosphingobium bradum]|uniref:YrhK domain-containing protein n=1 Tax=Novosphingobium bradum TaxID=1737444 RepID=A0ABV7IQW9_9SPHN
MWNSIWHLRGSVELEPETTNEDALTQIESLLSGQMKVISSAGEDFIEFGDSWRFWFGPSNRGLAMAVYDQGRFQIDDRGAGKIVQYDLSSLTDFLFCLLGACVFFAFASAGSSLAYGAKIGTFAFAWLYGINMILARLRIPRAIRKALGS